MVASLPWHRAAPGAQPHSALPWQERLGGACRRGTLQPPEDRGTEKPTPGPALGVWAGHKYVSVLQCSKQPLQASPAPPSCVFKLKDGGTGLKNSRYQLARG